MAQSRAKSGAKSGAKRKSGKRKSAKSGTPLWPWLTALAVVGGGIALYDHFGEARRLVAGLTGQKPVQTAARTEADHDRSGNERAATSPARPVPAAAYRPVPPRPTTPPDQSQTAAIIPPAPIGKPFRDAQPAAATMPVLAMLPQNGGLRPADGLAGGYQGKFFLCGSAKQDDCVVAADRFVFHGQKIRLVGVEVPDIKKPHCEAERIKASDAELRVRAFLDSGPFELQSWQGNDSEIDGHKLRAVTRDGRSLADILVNEGLAKRPGQGKGWC